MARPKKTNVFTNWTNESTWLERFTRKIQGAVFRSRNRKEDQ